MADRGFADLLHERVGGVEGRGGALSDVGDLRPAQRAPLLGADRSYILAAEDDVAAHNVAAAARVAHRGEADRRFARAGFADEADDLAAPQLQGDIVDQNRTFAEIRAHGDAHAANIEDDRPVAQIPSCVGRRVHALSPWPREWIESIQSTTKLTPMVRMAMAAAG